MSSALPEKSAGNQAPVVGKVVQGPAGDDAQQLREEIERTREHLGATVEQLAARLDVKSRARAEAAELSARLKRAGSQARQAAPGYARQAIAQGTKKARDQRVALSVAVGLAVAVSLVIWQRRRH
jgi:hypothetical protein